MKVGCAFRVFVFMKYIFGAFPPAPTWMNFIAYWLLQIPLAWALSVYFDWGPSGVFTAIAVGQCTLAAIGVLWFKRGTWKLREI